jgi:hypothetical protein
MLWVVSPVDHSYSQGKEKLKSQGMNNRHDLLLFQIVESTFLQLKFVLHWNILHMETDQFWGDNFPHPK